MRKGLLNIFLRSACGMLSRSQSSRSSAVAWDRQSSLPRPRRVDGHCHSHSPRGLSPGPRCAKFRRVHRRGAGRGVPKARRRNPPGYQHVYKRQTGGRQRIPRARRPAEGVELHERIAQRQVQPRPCAPVPVRPRGPFRFPAVSGLLTQPRTPRRQAPVPLPLRRLSQ